MATQQPRKHAEVDVAARQDHARGSVYGGGDRAGGQGGDADGAGALDHEAGPLQREHHRVGDGVLVDGDDVVEPVLYERTRHRAGALDGDAVGQRGDRTLGRRTVGVGRARFHLDADHDDRRVVTFHGDGDAAGQAAAAERHEDETEIGHVGQQFEPQRRLAGDHGLVVERRAEVHAGGRCAFAGERHGDIDRIAAERHGGAVAARRLGLRDRRAGRNEYLARHTAHAGGERQCLGMVAGATRHDPRLGGVAQLAELGHRPADLEAARALQVLGLQHDPPGTAHARITGTEAVGEEDGLQCRRVRHDTRTGGARRRDPLVGDASCRRVALDRRRRDRDIGHRA